MEVCRARLSRRAGRRGAIDRGTALAAAGDTTSTPTLATPETAGSSDAEPQPSDAVAFQPGRLTPEPVIAPAATKTGGFPPSPGAAAFIASTPAALNARREEQRRRHVWLALSIAQSGAATFDAWSTRRVVSNGGQELNPMLRPFAGNDSIYAAVQVTPPAARLRKPSHDDQRARLGAAHLVDAAGDRHSHVHRGRRV